MNFSSSDSSSSTSSNRNKSNTEASELYYAVRLRPQPTQWRPLHSNNNNNGNSNNGESATVPSSRHRVVVAADKSIILTWPRTRDERPIWASRWQAVFVFLLLLFLFLFLLILFYSLFLFFVFAVARAQKFPPLKVSTGWKWTRSKGDNINAAANGCQWSNAGHSGMKSNVQCIKMWDLIQIR